MFRKRNLVDQQLRRNDCGISAAKTICNIYHVPISRSLIEQDIHLDQDGSSLEDIRLFLTRSGFEANYNILDIEKAKKNCAYLKSLTPSITPIKTKKGKHYLVLKSYAKGKFTVLDPAESRTYKLGLEEFCQKAYFASNRLPQIEVEQAISVQINKMLASYHLSLPSEIEASQLTSTFNKLQYFADLKSRFPFKDYETEKSFLAELIGNKDDLYLPQQHITLEAIKEKISISAPVFLTVQKEKNIDIPEHSGGDNIYLKLYKNLIGIKDIWYIFLFTTVAASLITYLAVFINQILIDHVLPTYQMSTLLLFSLGVGVFYLFDIIFYGFKKYISIHLSNILDRYFLAEYDLKLNKFSIGYLNSFRRGDLVERLSDALKIKSFFTTFFSKIFINVVVATVSVVILVAMSWKLSMIIFGVLSLFIFLFLGITPIIRKLEKSRFEKKAEFFSKFIEKIDGIQVIKSFQLEAHSSRKINNHIENLLSVQLKSKFVDLLNSIITTVIISLSTLGIVVFASKSMIVDNSMTLGMIITFIALSSKIFRAFKSLLGYNLTLQAQEIILHRYFDFNEVKNIKSNTIPNQDLLRCTEIRSFELKQIDFAYIDDNYILKGLNLKIEKEDRIWIEGKNGSGKTTLCNIIGHLYFPSKGEILVNDIHQDLYDNRSIQQRIKFVSCDDLIFNESLLFNITFNRETNMNRLVELCKAINFYDFINSLPDKFNHSIHEKGRNLSTGQRRKLLLLRALMSNSEIIILDEIFNGMDNESKESVEKLINTITDKTFILISHTPITGINFTKLYQLKNGRLIETTTETGIIHQNPRFPNAVHNPHHNSSLSPA